MSDYKTLLGILTVLVQTISYMFYFWGIYKGKTKPHAFTWFVWGTLNVIAFTAVFLSGGEAGSWILAVNALFCFMIAGFGFYQKHVEYDVFDWLALIGAFIGIFLWWLTSNPLYAVILVSISDAIGVVPTMRKAYRLPFEENIAAFAVGMSYYPLAIFALRSVTVTTWLYPASVFVVDGILVALIVIRRKKLK